MGANQAKIASATSTTVFKFLQDCVNTGAHASENKWCPKLLQTLIQFYATAKDSATECQEVCSALKNNQDSTLQELIDREAKQVKDHQENFVLPVIILSVCVLLVLLQIVIIVRSYFFRYNQSSPVSRSSVSQPPSQSTIVNLPLLSHRQTQTSRTQTARTVEPRVSQSQWDLPRRGLQARGTPISGTPGGISGEELLALMKREGFPNSKTSCPKHHSSRGHKTTSDKNKTR